MKRLPIWVGFVPQELIRRGRPDPKSNQAHAALRLHPLVGLGRGDAAIRPVDAQLPFHGPEEAILEERHVANVALGQVTILGPVHIDPGTEARALASFRVLWRHEHAVKADRVERFQLQPMPCLLPFSNWRPLSGVLPRCVLWQLTCIKGGPREAEPPLLLRALHRLRAREEVTDGPAKAVLPGGQEPQEVIDVGPVHRRAKGRLIAAVDREEPLLLIPDARIAVGRGAELRDLARSAQSPRGSELRRLQGVVVEVVPLSAGPAIKCPTAVRLRLGGDRWDGTAV
eukprot:8312380-Alexandrium_andersonii.AAC.4